MSSQSVSNMNIIYHRPDPGKAHSEMINRMMATYEIARHNRPQKELSPEERTAIGRLRDSSKIKDWGPDLIIKAFQDLDTVFYKGCLVGNCLLRWRDLEGCDQKSRSGECSWYGITKPAGPKKNRQCEIILSAQHIIFGCRDPYIQMWRTMLVSGVPSSALTRVVVYLPDGLTWVKLLIPFLSSMKWS